MKVGIGIGESSRSRSVGCTNTNDRGVRDAVGLEINVDTTVNVGVLVGMMVSPPLIGIIKEDVVGVKKSSAKASLVIERSSGVAVAVYLGWRTIPSCVSSLPPASITGRLKARTQTPIKTSRTTNPCDFTKFSLLS